MTYQPEQAINIAKGCVMASAMDNETKMAVLEMLNLVAIPKTETTDCEWCDSGIDTASVMSADMMMRFVRPVNFCPNCGRKLD